MYYFSKNISIPCLYGLVAMLSGCASISSEMVCGNNVDTNCSKDVDDGITYYMPKRSIRLTITVSTETGNNKKVVVNVDNNYTTETTPDLSRVFLLRYNKNLIGQNNMYIGVNSYGLLSVTHSDTISKINQIASNIAMDVAVSSIGVGLPPTPGATPDTNSALTTPFEKLPGSLGEPAQPSSHSVTINNVTTSCGDGSYSLLIDPKNPSELQDRSTTCGVDIKITSGFKTSDLESHKDSKRITSGDRWNTFSNTLDFHSHNKGHSLPGLFYKQDLPYIVTVKHGEAKSQFIALSPNESKIYFAPIVKTLFTDNTSDISLVNGVVTTLRENTDSEILALTKIPADALGAYTDSIGKVFSGIGTSLKAQKESVSSEISLLNNMAKIRQCQVAIATNNITGKTGDELNKAFMNIQTACAN